MYSKLTVKIIWQGVDSQCISVCSGVRQGGILSPLLFNVYVDCILTTMRKLDYGCHIRGVYCGCIMYADDLLLISASVIELQNMLNVCSDIGSQLSITFNYKKSMCLMIGPNRISSLASLNLNGAALSWENKIKYLGIWILSDKSFHLDLSETRRKFFMSVNYLLSKCKYTGDLVKLQLCESQCLPILLYATECVNLNNSDLKAINSWWNSVYRKIFGYNKWKSVKQLICQLNQLDFPHIVNLRCLTFAKRMLYNEYENDSFRKIFQLYNRTGEAVSVTNKYKLQLSWSVPKLKAMAYASFHELVVT